MYKDFYGEPVMHHHDHCHDHMGPLEFAQVSNAGAYARLYSKLITHIEDNVRHITAEERDKWNKKADKIDLEELALKMVKKANKSDIPTLVSELKNDVPYLTKADLNTQIVNLDVPTWDDLNNWITGKLNGYALESWVLQKIGEIAKADLSSYATKNWVADNYMPKFNLQDYATRSWVLDQLSGYTPGSGSGTTYTAGEGINIANNVISLKVAKDGQLGGIRTNYQTDANNRNYGVRVNNQGQAYVNVPWEKGSGSGSGSGDSGKYYDQAFKTTDTLDMPALPSAGFPNADDGWRRFAENADATKYVWMATRAINDGVADEWLGPWLISGPEGQAGRDGKGIEFVYIRTANDTVDAAAISNLNAQYGTDTFQADDYIPTNWTDNPQGITKDLPYEWVAIRTSDRNGVWSQFIGPILWSKWGQNGMDGDGVEYIFYAAASEVTFSGSLNPATWLPVQTDEYLGPDNGATWKDNPIDLATIGQGAYEWVSMRKRNGEGGEWGAFSQPALWAYYSKDGVADGYILNLTKDSFLCQVDEEGTSQAATFETAVELFYNGTRVTPTAISIGQIKLNGTNVTSTQANATNNNGDITITVGNIQNATFKTLTVPVTVSFVENGENEEKTVIASVYFFRAADGKGISLNTSASVIKFNYYKTVANPAELEVWALIGDTKITPTSSDKLGYNFYWKYNSTTSTTAPQLLTSNTISNYDTNYTGITVMLYKGNEVYLTQAIPYVFDGAPGIGVKQYSIQVLSSTLAVFDDTDNSKKVNGTVTFKAFRHFGGEDDIEITPSSRPNNEGVVVYANNRELHPTYNNGVWTAGITNEGFNDGYGYANLRIVSDTSSVLASVVVPFAIQGPQGSSMVQGLNGTVMRLWNYDSTQMYYDGDVADSNGVTYLDIVRYPANSATGGAYYRLKPAGRTGAANPGAPVVNGEVSQYWEEFSTPADSAAFQAIIAKYGFIENLTGREIVVTNSDNTPVAGITNGTAVDGDGDAIDGVNRGNVRIWAGTPAANGNLADCPFYVTDEGFLHAENGEFGGSLSSATGSFKYLSCVDNNGNDVGGIGFGTDAQHPLAALNINADIYQHRSSDTYFKGDHVAVGGSFGAFAHNAVIIQESGSESIPPTVSYAIYRPLKFRTSSAESVVRYFTRAAALDKRTVNGKPIYEIPLMYPSSLVNMGAMPNGITNYMWDVPFDVVIILAASGSGNLSYEFTNVGVGKKITVINSSNNTYACVATHGGEFTNIGSNTACEMVYIGSWFSGSSSSSKPAESWFITGKASN